MKGMNLTLPPDAMHIPYGREYGNSNEAQLAIAQFQEELGKLLERFGVHCFIFNGSVSIKPVSAPVHGADGTLSGQIRTRVVCRADGCPACTIYAVAQGAIINPDQNKVLLAAGAMVEQVLREQAEEYAAEQAARDFDTMDAKGPKQ